MSKMNWKFWKSQVIKGLVPQYLYERALGKSRRVPKFKVRKLTELDPGKLYVFQCPCEILDESFHLVEVLNEKYGINIIVVADDMNFIEPLSKKVKK